jgi:aryl-alcohol dehydrogenase-like predicted oxidoreductase
MDAFVREGKIRHVGVSNFDARQMASFEATCKIDVLQPPYHVFRRDIEESILPYTLHHRIGVLIYGPLAHGLLTGKYTPSTVFRADDWRSKSQLFRGETLRQNLATVAELERFAEQREFPVGQLAIAWTLANPAVDVAIVGARTPAQIEIERIMNSAVGVGGPAPETV